MSVPPLMNADSPEKWESDRNQAKRDIIDWLAESASTSHSRSLIEDSIRDSLAVLEDVGDLPKAIISRPSLLMALRALTRRDVGTSQIATFLEVGESTYKAIEREEKSADQIVESAVELLRKEIDEGLASWILEGRAPSDSERTRSIIVAADRILRRGTSTELRYKHEPRQLGKLQSFLKDLGYEEVPGKEISNPRTDMESGTFAVRVNIDGTTVDGVTLKQNVDTLVMPHSESGEVLPIFLEAKSMTDEVNPNKRQKEEAQKVDNVRRRWQGEGERLNFVLLLGGTVPRRYLEVEAGSGLDWIWEHRVEDLSILLDWYKSQ